MHRPTGGMPREDRGRGSGAVSYDAAEFLESTDTATPPPVGSARYREVLLGPDGRWVSDDGQTGEVDGWATRGSGPRFLRAFLETSATAGWAFVTLAQEGDAFRLIFTRRRPG